MSVPRNNVGQISFTGKICPLQLSGISHKSLLRKKVSRNFRVILNYISFMTLRLWQRTDVSFARGGTRSTPACILLVRVPSRGGHQSRTISVPIHSFLRRARERRRRAGEGEGKATGGKGRRRAQARRLTRKLPPRLYGPEERVIPFNRGIEFFPDAESSWHRVRTTPPPFPPYYPAFPLPRVTHTRVPAVPPTSTRPPTSPRYPVDSTFAVAVESCP